jgi:ferric-dicitrate binding protein FerR (iron transport regulator)
MSAIEDRAMIFRYLLQDITSKEQEEIERRYFSDPEYLAQIEAAEGDLMDAYLRGELSRAHRNLFEENFLCTRARRERLKMAEALHRHLPRPRPDRRLWYGVGAALLALAAAAVWWLERLF